MPLRSPYLSAVRPGSGNAESSPVYFEGQRAVHSVQDVRAGPGAGCGLAHACIVKP